MLISKNWLQEFVDISKIAPQEIAKRLTLSTVEVEGVKVFGEGLEKVVVGVVKSVEKHSNADKLNVCQVEVGKKTLNIVCGGSNVRPGMKVALAQIGAKVRWHGQGDLVELKPVEIRGVASEGMICASEEIGLLEMFTKKEEKEILDLSTVALTKAGLPLATALCLDDVIFEIDNKSLSHRPDLWGHYGIAREVATLLKKSIRSYQTKIVPKGTGVKLTVNVEDKKLCPRYMGIALENITVQPSPVWLQTRLRAVGIRPINNLVDITNYVMVEIGQPMHAFDADRLHKSIKALKHENSIVVRRAKDGERLKALYGKEYTLTKGMLLIAGREKPLAIAGVMGGEESGVTEATKTIIFESANFDPVSIRKTSTTLGLRSESSARFEKGLSPERAELALKKAIELTLALVPGARVASPLIDKKVPLKKSAVINLALEDIKKKLGVSIPATEILSILLGLGFDVSKKKDVLRVTVPLWRAKDVTIPEDVMEEIVRIYGYAKIPATLPTFPITPPPANPLRVLEHRVREFLAYEHGFTEVYNYSFLSPDLVTRLGLEVSAHLELANPLAKDRPLLRRTLKGGLLENVESNFHRYAKVKLFEIGRTYLGETLVDSLPDQPTMLALAYAESGVNTPFFVVSQALKGSLSRVGIEIDFEKSLDIGSLYHPGRSAYVTLDGQKVGSIGELHPTVAKRMGIDARVAIAEIALTALLPHLKEKTSYAPIPAFPAVVRDIAFVVSKTVVHADVVKALKLIDPLIVKVTLFDIFSGGNISTDKKSMAYHIVYESREKTLAAADVDAVHARVIKKLQEQFGAEIR
ncbi:MAG: phenylalanine--tRNA ligase subunit beta [Patescibacteria group bacterium]